MKKLVHILILILLAGKAFASDPQNNIIQGNKAYQEGLYENAISLYESVINDGYHSSILYFNLGNAYYKMNEIPSAILYYERALKLDPGNEDIIYNLRVANNQIIDKIDQLPKLFYEKWWASISQLFAPDQWALLSILFLLSFFIIMALFLLSTSVNARRWLLSIGIVTLIMTAFVFIIAQDIHSKTLKKHEAIVFAPSLPVKSSPEESGIDLFVIHEGLKVQIIDELTGWKEIKIDNGSKGWVKSETITPI